MAIEPVTAAPLLPPGTFIEEWLEDEVKTQRELAQRLDVSEKHLSQVINGHKPISADFAAKLALVTGYPAEFWLVHQAKYDARRKSVGVNPADINEVKQILDGKCIARLRKSGLIKSSWRAPEALVLELFSHARVASVKALIEQISSDKAVAYRQSNAFKIDSGHVWAWLEIVRFRAALQGELPDFRASKLQDALPQLREITTDSPDRFVPRVTEVLNSCGVAFVAEPDIEGARIAGASFEIDGAPAIAVTDRHQREDIFWFTLFHEIAHVMAGDFHGVHLEPTAASELSEKERKADEWASVHLLPPVSIDFRAGSPMPSSEQIAEIAHLNGVSEAIVIGCIAHIVQVHGWGRDKIRAFKISD